MLRYAFLAGFFVVIVAHYYLRHTNIRQAEEGMRLGVRVQRVLRFDYIDVTDPRASDELRRAYRKTNRLRTLNFAAFLILIVLLVLLT